MPPRRARLYSFVQASPILCLRFLILLIRAIAISRAIYASHIDTITPLFSFRAIAIDISL
jgi:hypothetical protein